MRQFNKILIIGMIALLAGGGIGGFTTYLIISPQITDAKNEADYWKDQYYDLFGNNQTLIDALQEPLTNPVIPSMNEVIDWLSVDDTDTFPYVDGIWMCGDYAAMLMTRAKTMNWRMRIACMYYAFSGETGYGDTADPYGSHGHAFNLIYVQDIPSGDPDSFFDILYIEPQTDVYWFVVNGTGGYNHYDIWTYYSGGMAGTVWSSGMYWVNHYSFFA